MVMLPFNAMQAVPALEPARSRETVPCSLRHTDTDTKSSNAGSSSAGTTTTPSTAPAVAQSSSTVTGQPSVCKVSQVCSPALSVDVIERSCDTAGPLLAVVSKAEESGPQDGEGLGDWTFGASCHQNKRSHMEDRLVMVDLKGHKAWGERGATLRRAALFAVCDGHSGHEVRGTIPVREDN